MGDGATAGTDAAHVDRRGPHLQVADHGLAADPGLEVLHEGDIGRGPAHVEGEEVAEASLLGHPGRAGDAAGRSGQQQADRVVRRDPGTGQSAVAAQHVKRSVDPRRAQLVRQAGQVARHLRLHVAVGDRGEGALVLPHLRQDRGGDRHLDAREHLGGDLRDPLLVRVVGVGVDERDGERLDAQAGQAGQRGAGAVLVEGGHLGPVGTDASDDLDGVLQVGQRLGLRPDDPAGQAAGHEGPGDLQHLAEAVGGHQADPGPLALQDRVGRDSRAVQHL